MVVRIGLAQRPVAFRPRVLAGGLPVVRIRRVSGRRWREAARVRGIHLARTRLGRRAQPFAIAAQLGYRVRIGHVQIDEDVVAVLLQCGELDLAVDQESLDQERRVQPRTIEIHDEQAQQQLVPARTGDRFRSERGEGGW